MNDSKTVYLDNAATTPLDPAVLIRMEQVARTIYANPSSIHSLGQQSKVLLEESRKSIASAIGAKPSEIVFTGGGTESVNIALMGIALAHRNRGNHIITTRVEHPAVLETIKFLQTLGFEISFLEHKIMYY